MTTEFSLDAREEARAKIEDSKAALECLTHKFLRDNGWTYTSSTPGCVWMWTKAIDGTTYAVNTANALRMEDEL
jgi:hypothetical protein